MSALRRRLTLTDLVIMILPVVISFVLLCGERDEGPRAVRITTPGGIWRYRLPATRVLRFEGSAGPFFLELDGGVVRIRETHCPDKLCQEMGPLHKTGQVMICVPQRIEIRLEGGEPEVDAVCR